MDTPLPNVWLGVTAEDQDRADERIPDLLATPAAVRFVSVEPMLGAVDFTMIATGQKLGSHDICIDALSGPPDFEEGERLDWVICGGESGHGARPMHPDWARSLRDQCKAACVPFFFKQWGEWAFEGQINPATGRPWRWSLDAEGEQRVGKSRAGRLLDGVEHSEFPQEIEL